MERFMDMRRLFYGGEGFGGVAGNIALLALRVFTGLTLAFNHGIHKIPPSDRFIAGVGTMGFPFPEFFSYAVAATEFAGGLLLAFGLGTRVSSAFILITMLVIVFIRHADDPFRGSRELAAVFGMLAVLFLVGGPGGYSLDARLMSREQA